MRVGAIVLAAGLSSRMGVNKLLLAVRGKPMIRHAVEAALASKAEPVIVVTGHDGAKIADGLCGLDILLADNNDFATGLSSSLKCGLNILPADCDGALILLGDMPFVSAGLLDSLIAAFDPTAGRAICVPVRDGRRGNPVLWARRFFPEMLTLTGDRGAKALLDKHGSLAHEVAVMDDGPFLDIDEPETLSRLA
jgi:molybdenum cofactor cytidylyltransferase